MDIRIIEVLLYLKLTDNCSCITQCTFRLVSQFSLTLLLGHLFTEMCETTKRWPSDKVKENCKTNIKVHCVMQLQLSVSFKYLDGFP